VQEGGYSNDAHDPGGMTMMGIIQQEYDLKRQQWGLPTPMGEEHLERRDTDHLLRRYWCRYCPSFGLGSILNSSILT
jgi:lysozyme family protein